MEEERMDQSEERMTSFIAMARQLIDQGKPTAALQAVMAAVTSQGGAEAVRQLLQRAREISESKLQPNAAADQLVSLLTEHTIHEYQPVVPRQLRPPPDGRIQHVPTLLNAVTDASLLAMGGRKQVMLDAFSDGSSFICLRCGGIISNLRKDAHLAYWCGED